MPDDALTADAPAGALRTEEGVRAAVRRMLADPKSDGLRQGFASQWLSTRALALHSPDPTVYPDFDEPLRAAMIAEAELFFADFIGNGRPIGDMMTPNFGYPNPPPGPPCARPSRGVGAGVRVSLPPQARRGLLMQGAWLTATAASDRTSPVNRGRWILEQVLCTEIPPPPPDIPPLMKPGEGETVRETLAKHRENPVCAGCHNLLDPAGLGMEGFDGIGAVRIFENGRPVDVSGAIPTDLEFEGAADLAGLLADDPRFSECLTEKLFAYALGREKVPADRPYLEYIAEELPLAGGGLDHLIELIAASPAFRMRAREAE